MKKRTALLPCLLLLLICTVCSLASCQQTLCQHTWNDATCTTPKTCSQCGIKQGATLEHDWADATCEKPKTCKVCNTEQGEALGHDWANATCETPKTCLVCAVTEGETLDHRYEKTVLQGPSCWANGKDQFTCADCGDYYTLDTTPPTYSDAEIRKMAEGLVGEIVSYNQYNSELSVGSCFAYMPHGWIITNYSVLENAYSAKVKLNGRTYEVKKVLSYDKASDFILLSIEASNLQKLPVCEATHKVGTTVYAFGGSKGTGLTVSKGTITKAEHEMGGVVYVEHNASMTGIAPGGPLIDEFGDIIGITTGSVSGTNNLNLAISTQETSGLNASTPLTVNQFREKEREPFNRMKNHIIENGDYDSENKMYTLIVGFENTEGHLYTRTVVYHAVDKAISLTVVVDTGFYFELLLTEDMPGSYEWGYVDEYNNVMVGAVIASTYTLETQLEYSKHNMSDDDLVAQVRKLASDMMQVIMFRLSTDWTIIEITPADLGFVSFE